MSANNTMFSVTVFLYKNGMKILYIRNNGNSTYKIIPFNKIFYRSVKKLVKLYRGKNANFEVFFYPILTLEDFDD